MDVGGGRKKVPLVGRGRVSQQQFEKRIGGVMDAPATEPTKTAAALIRVVVLSVSRHLTCTLIDVHKERLEPSILQKVCVKWICVCIFEPHTRVRVSLRNNNNIACLQPPPGVRNPTLPPFFFYPPPKSCYLKPGMSRKRLVNGQWGEVGRGGGVKTPTTRMPGRKSE